MPSRRQLIFGAFRPSPPTGAPRAAPERSASDNAGQPAIVAFAEHCLAYQNVVCRSCGERCEHDAIRFSPRLGGAPEPQLVAERCTGCGDCLVVCPNAALSLVTPTETSHRSAEELAA